MKILVTGGSGQLGKCLIKQLNNNYSVISPSHYDMDIVNYNAVEKFIFDSSPDIIIHSAAYSNVEKAELEPDICFDVNSKGTENIVNVAKAKDIYVIYISTDFVFDGTKKEPYLPNDIRNPLSVYGLSKMQGEDAVLSASSKNLIIRTSWMFGPSDNNFVESIIRASYKKRELEVVADQVGCPTYAVDLSFCIKNIIPLRLSGIINATNEGYCTRADFAREILSIKKINCNITDVKSNQYKSLAKRPLNSVLDSSCLNTICKEKMPHWKSALERYINSRKEIL